MKWFTAVAALATAVGSGCQSISTVHGWDGPQLEVTVDRSGGELVMLAPTGGWTLTIDRANETPAGVTLWVTAHRPEGIVSQAFTRVRARWTPDSGPGPNCIEARVRINQGMYVPAAEGCR